MFVFTFFSPRRKLILETEILGKYIQLFVFYFIYELSQPLLLTVRVSFFFNYYKLKLFTIRLQLVFRDREVVDGELWSAKG